jgi:hypothetical protein
MNTLRRFGSKLRLRKKEEPVVIPAQVFTPVSKTIVEESDEEQDWPQYNASEYGQNSTRYVFLGN